MKVSFILVSIDVYLLKICMIALFIAKGYNKYKGVFIMILPYYDLCWCMKLFGWNCDGQGDV